ncbi:hypothetical protein ECC18A13_p10170 (plasmid) [Enterobacter sp. 18A13]|nr:hypothetical protein ECC18A13_p10170 [Enterobacter sp. 18A13]
MAQQSHILPDCDWQHITFTMPHLLWPFFNNNWPLLNQLFQAATRAMLRWARKQGVEVGIFCALHTCGRQLNQHPHIHLSVTRGGLDIKHSVWRDLFFKKQPVEEIWRGAVIHLLRHSYDLINPGSLPGLGHIRDKKQWQRYLQAQYGRRWKVHFAHPLCEEDPGCLAERQIPRPVPEATAGVGGKAQALQRRRRGAPLLRPPDAAAPETDADSGRDERALYQSYPGEAF